MPCQDPPRRPAIPPALVGHPCPADPADTGDSGVDCTNCAEKLLPLQWKPGDHQIQNRKRTEDCEHVFGLLSEGEKVKMQINLSCWKNTLQK